MTDVEPEEYEEELEEELEEEEEDEVDPKEYEKLRDLLLQKCSWIEDLNDLFRFIQRRKLGRPPPSHIQSNPYLLYSLYHYIIFGEPLPCTKTAEEWRDIIWYYGGAGKNKIEDFVKSLSPIKVESMRKTAEECERVGKMKLSEIGTIGIKEKVKAWAKSADERLRRAAEMTIEEFAKSRIWKRIVREIPREELTKQQIVEEETVIDPETQIKTTRVKSMEYTTAYVLEEMSNRHPMYKFFESEIILVLREAGLASRYVMYKYYPYKYYPEEPEDISEFIVDVWCMDIENPCKWRDEF